jgi:hypothetical protein
MGVEDMKALKKEEVMRRVQTSRDTNVSKTGILRQFRRTAEAGALALGLLTLGAAPLLVPSTAKAEAARTDISRLRTVRVTRALSELDGETEQYRGTERIPTRRDPIYSNAATIPGEVTAIVGYNPRHGHRLVVTFPRERDSDPSAEGAGIRGLSLDQFARVVRERTGQELRRMRIILETGTFQRSGQETTYTNIYVLPVDAEGRVLTSLGSGRYLMYGASYYGSTLRGGVSILAEPHDRTTMAIAMRTQ